MRFAHSLGLLAPLLLVGCDDEFNYNSAHGGAVDGEGIDAVLQIVDGNCVGCHSGASASAGLDLATDFCATVLDGRLVIEGDSAGSVLVQRISDAGAPMPPAGLMEQGNIDIVADWVDAGASCASDGGGGGAQTGEELYASRCASCHGDAGQGVSAPALGDVVPGEDVESITETILFGEGNMPPIDVTAGDATLIAEFVVATWGD